LSRRATVINLVDRYIVVTGEPILDTREGVLIVAFADGTSRVFNWEHVIDYYYMTEDEYARHVKERD
jgi:hypothetical protein